jgi:hypothetical protein
VALLATGLLALSCSSDDAQAAGGDGTRLDVDYVSIPQSADGTTGADCYASKEGTSVVVKDGAGAIVGTGRVGVGTWQAHPDGFNHDCVHRATVELQETDYYVVSIEGLGGELTYSRDELASNGWTVGIG